MFQASQTKICLSLCIIFLIGATLAPSISQADPSPISAAQKMQEKKKMLQFLAERLQKHKTMELEAIREELLTSLRANRVFLQAQQSTPLDEKVMRAFELTEEDLWSLQDKQEILEAEEIQIAELLSARNYLFGMSRSTLEWGAKAMDAGYSGGFFAPLGLFITFPLDIVFLPATFIISLLTDFS